MLQQDSRFLTKFFGMLIGLFVVMVLLIILANLLYEGSTSNDVSKDPMVQAAIESRIKPVGVVNIAGQGTGVGAPAAAAKPAAALTGQQIVQQTCAACHGTGVMGAPKIGNTADWAPRIKKGLATLLDHAEHGFKQMPARGGKPTLTDDDLKHAIAYMLSKVGVKDAFSAKAKAPAPAKPAAAKAAPAAGGGVDLAKGKQVVQGTCFACHGTGVMGAPKIGNKADWAPRIKKGIATLLDHAEHGFKSMPAHGGKPSLTNAELKDAIEYMLSQSK